MWEGTIQGRGHQEARVTGAAYHRDAHSFQLLFSQPSEMRASFFFLPLSSYKSSRIEHFESPAHSPVDTHQKTTPEGLTLHRNRKLLLDVEAVEGM